MHTKVFIFSVKAKVVLCILFLGSISREIQALWRYCVAVIEASRRYGCCRDFNWLAWVNIGPVAVSRWFEGPCIKKPELLYC